MMKCDMCYDRTSVGKKPMCATVCPSQALFFGTREEIEQLRPRSAPVNQFQFGEQTITTRVNVMMPRGRQPRAAQIDVTAAMDERPRNRGRAPAGDRHVRSVRRSGGLSDARRDPSDDVPGPSDGPTRDPEDVTVAPDGRPMEEQPRVASGLPDRHAAGPTSWPAATSRSSSS